MFLSRFLASFGGISSSSTPLHDMPCLPLLLNNLSNTCPLHYPCSRGRQAVICPTVPTELLHPRLHHTTPHHITLSHIIPLFCTHMPHHSTSRLNFARHTHTHTTQYTTSYYTTTLHYTTSHQTILHHTKPHVGWESEKRRWEETYYRKCVVWRDHVESLWVRLTPASLPHNIVSIIVGVLYHPPRSPLLVEHLINTADSLSARYPNAKLVVTSIGLTPVR